MMTLKKGFVSISFFIVYNVFGCNQITSSETTVNTQNNDPHAFVDIDIPKDQVETESLRRAALGLRGAMAEGTQNVPLQQLVDVLQLEGPVLEVIPGILDSHPGPISITCRGLTCNGKSMGKSHSFVADFVDLPLFGKPTVYLDPEIEMELNLSDDGQYLEICRLTGVSAKARGLGGNIDGFIFRLKNQQTEVLKVDIGMGGRYPNDRCKIKGKT